MKYTILLAAAFMSAPVCAINVNLMQHSHSPVFMQTEDALTKNSLPNETLIYSSYYNYVKSPLVVTTPDRRERIGTVVDGIGALHFGVGYQSSNRFLIGYSSFAANVHQTNKDPRWAMGDSRLIGKYRMSPNEENDAFALIPELELPTGKKDLYISNGGFGTGIKLAYEREFEFMRLSVNTGYMYNDQAKYLDLDYRHRLTFSAGVHVPFDDYWGMIGEATTSRTFKKYQNPGEVYMGGRYQWNENLAMNAGTSVGNLGGAGSSEFRVLVGLKWVPQLSKDYHIKSIISRLTEREKKIIKRILEIREEIKFDHDSFVLNEKSQKALDQIAQLLTDESHEFRQIVIEGHANRIGEAHYNLVLSESRARAVRDYLVTKGIKDSLLNIKAFGATKPKPIEDWAQAKMENRRVEFFVEK
ncbi:MAG: OmpA family protein [Bacteriovorax sp.]|jgi:outer membrane protein OmpA-like peptidoglycan-associated protein